MIFTLTACGSLFLSVYSIVHCRTGSLEMFNKIPTTQKDVHCRTGSLEISVAITEFFSIVHCRTGSLEISRLAQLVEADVHCRTGSLETNVNGSIRRGGSSLLHRQLRNSREL